MRVFAIIIAAAALSGCAGKLQLLSEGRAYHGTYHTADKSMAVDIDGETYRGSYVMGQTFGVANTYATAYGGRTVRSGFASTFASSSSNQGRALLVSSSNKTLRCDIMAQGLNGQGLCQDGQGRLYDLIATAGQ